KGGTATPAQPRVGHFLHDRGAAHLQHASQPTVAAMRRVIIERERCYDTHPREGESLLVFQESDLLCRPEAQMVLATVQEVVFEQGRAVRRPDGTVCDPPSRRFDLDQRLEPEQAARAVAYQGDTCMAQQSLPHDVSCDGIGTERDGAGVAG